VRGPLAGRVDDVHDLGATEVAEAEPEVERRADHHDHVGALERGAARLGERERVLGRQRAAPHPVGEDRHVQGFGRLTKGGDRVAGVHVGAGDDHGALGGGDQLGGPGHVVRIGLHHGYVRRGGRVGVSGGEDHFERKVEEGGPAVRGERGGQRGGDRTGDLLAGADRRGVLGDRPDQRQVVDLLQAPRTPPERGRPPADHEHRRTVEVRAGQPRDAVGDTRPGGEHGEARPALQLGDRLGREDRRLLVPHVVEGEAGLVGRVVEREDVTAGEGEHLLDAVRPQRRQRQFAAVSLDPLG
jgi:hypothetical protein